MAQIIDLRGESERIARNLASIGQSVGGIINPNLELQEQVKAAVASNPELGSALGSLPPDVLEGIGLGNLQPFLAQFPETSGQLLEKLKRGAFTDLPEETRKAMTEFLQAGAVGTTPTGLAVEPTRAAAARATTLEPGEQKALGKELVTGKTEAQRTEEDLLVRTRQNASGLLDRFEEGQELSPRDRGVLRVTVGRALFEDEDAKQAHQFNLELARARDKASYDRLFERNRIDNAEYMQRNTRVGSIQEWMQWLEDPSARSKPEFSDLTSAAQNLDVRQKLPRAAAISTRLGVIGRDISRAAEERQEEAIPSLLQLAEMQLAMFDALDIPNVRIPRGLRPVYKVLPKEDKLFEKVKPGDVGIFEGLRQLVARAIPGKKQFFYEDAEGRVYNPDLVEAITSGGASFVPDEEETQDTFDPSTFESNLVETIQGIPVESLRAYADAVIEQNADHPNLGQIRAIVNKVIAQRSR